MNKTKILIQIFPMVKDIDYLERTLLLLKQNSFFIDKEKYHVILDVTLLMSDYLTDWNNSILKQNYFLEKFEHFKKYGDCWDECYFNVDYDVCGFLDSFTKKLNTYNVNNIIILETDIIFNSYTLKILAEASSQVHISTPEYIITPEHTKLWDNSWDIIVNSKFINSPLNHRDVGEPLLDTFYTGEDIEIIPLISGNNRYFKFGGGWFTMYSKKLLDKINFPLSLKGYGALDNFITQYCLLSPHPIQYKIKNLIITEDCKYTKPSLYNDYVCSLNKKQDLYEYNNTIMMNHFKNMFGF
jgi:hypothetical protein